jgi:hypothetical protein
MRGVGGDSIGEDAGFDGRSACGFEVGEGLEVLFLDPILEGAGVEAMVRMRILVI